MSVGGVRFCRLVLILMLVSIGLRGRIGVAGKNPFYLLSSIYSSFTKLWCENYGETQWEEEYPLPVSSTRRYFKMQSVHGPSVYRTVPSAQYKPQQCWPDSQMSAYLADMPLACNIFCVGDCLHSFTQISLSTRTTYLEILVRTGM
jgi:hypothetical protein